MTSSSKDLFSLVVYVPIDSADHVKQAMFNAGAGKIGLYEACCWEVEGVGQFRPLQGSDPTIGEHGEITRVPELRVELVCESHCLDEVVAALRASHPYEKPAYHYFRVNNVYACET